jgi:hypothetical protein
MSDPIDPKVADNILCELREKQRLSNLSDLDLIRECLTSDAFDYTIVEELCDRLKPNWLEEVGKP